MLILSLGADSVLCGPTDLMGTYYLPKKLSPNTIMSRVIASTYEYRHNKIQFIAHNN